ncbi:Sex-determining region Y protein [Mizuhopecten yessoensis]|uniref:Sex-determining region Y protein n=1 Tax=Mizuhopecten yessoensis TaxID=6573 RepID=A0A210PI98_MIZYE|nr:SOX transcription factor [Mizuhopecten yessoensis]OWF36205.1 Sex-determining region Y protein [Mizuhopecten yessoensis]
MTEHLTKRTIDYVDQDVSESQNEDTSQSKKVKWDSDERNIDISENTPKQQQDEDRNNSNGPVKVKVTVSEFTERLKVPVPDPIPYRIVVNEKCKDRNFDDEAQKASHILKNIVMEKMNDKLTDDSSMSAFQRVQQQDDQPMVALPCKAQYSRPALPVHHFPSQRGFYPPFVRQNFAGFGNLTSLPRVGIPRMVEQSGKIMVQPIPPVPSVTIRNLPPIHGIVPARTFIQTSTGTVAQETGTITSMNDQAYGLPSSEYFSKITSPAIKATTVQVMPGTSMTYKTPGASHKNRHGKVKRPMNAFMVWARNYRSRLSEEMPQASNAQISVRLGQIWGSMPLADKEKYFREAERIKLQHNRDFPGWVYQPKQKKMPSESQHDRLWARFGSNTCKDQPKEMTSNTCQEGIAPTVHQIMTPTPVTVYPKTLIANTPNISMTSPLPSFSQLTQTVSDPTPIVSLETGRHPTPGSLATTDSIKSGPVSGSIDSSQGPARRPTAFQVVSSSQPPAFAVQPSPKIEHELTSHLTVSKTGHYPLKMSTSSLMATGSPTNGSVRSLSSSTVTGCPSPKGRPPSISRRVSLSETPAMLISAQRAYQEARMTRSHSDGPSKTKPTTSSGPITTTRISDQRQKSDAAPLTTVSDVRPPGSQRPSKCADPVDELWPFPLPTVEHTPHVDVLYDGRNGVTYSNEYHLINRI